MEVYKGVNRCLAMSWGCIREVLEESGHVMEVSKEGHGGSLAMSWGCIREVMEESSHVMVVYKEAVEMYIDIYKHTR